MGAHMQRRLLFDTLILGAIGAVIALGFNLLLDISHSFLLGGITGAAAAETMPVHPWLIPVSTTLGGLLAGLLTSRLAPEAIGIGTNVAIKAFHQAGAYLRLRVPFVKLLTAAVTIGSGGASGREGPTYLAGGAIGALYAHYLGGDDAKRRLLLLVGAAAALSAIFRAPIGMAIFTVEVLYSGMEFEATALIYAMLAAIESYAIVTTISGSTPLFHLPADVTFPVLTDYLWYLLLGLVAGVLATAIPTILYACRDGFRQLAFPAILKPALGGLGLGLIAIGMPQVMSGGYAWIQMAINGRLALSIMAMLIVAKIAAFVLTIGSGGSGGVFAPTLFVGAMLGGTVAAMFGLPAAPFAMIGMAAVFGAAARAPFAIIIAITEMTGGYQLLPAAACAVLPACLLQMALCRVCRLRYPTLYESQVRSQIDSPTHAIEHIETALDLLRERRIRVPASVGHVDLIALLQSGIPIDLPRNERMLLYALPADSPLAGKAIGTLHRLGAGLDIIAVRQQGRWLHAHADTTLGADDQLLVIVDKDGKAQLTGVLSPLQPGEMTKCE